MKILYIHQYFAVPDSGGATRSYEMARRLAQAGHDVTMLTTSAFLPDSWASKPGWNYHNMEGILVDVFRLPYSNKMSFGRRGWCFIRFLFAAILRARQWSGDIVFATSTPLTVAIPGIQAARKNRVPMIFEVRDLWPEIPIAVGALNNPVLIALTRWLERYAYHNSTHIVALSEGMANGVTRRGVPRERVSVIPNGCDVELFRVTSKEKAVFQGKHPYLKESLVVAYTGTLGHVNGVGYLVEIAKEMRSLDPSINFVIVGDGAEADDIRQHATTLGLLEEQLWILNSRPKSEVAALLSVSSIAVSLVIDLPEMWNNSANKVFDALAAGCPVMINYGGWQAEFLRESGAGIVVPPNNAEETAKQLHKFLRDKDRRQFAAQSAHELAKKRFNRDHLAQQLQELIEKTAGKLT